jgi:hypothetical protein
MNKLLAVTLPCFWLLFIYLEGWEHLWIVRSILECHIGVAMIYLWKYNDLRDELLKVFQRKTGE